MSKQISSLIVGLSSIGFLSILICSKHSPDLQNESIFCGSYFKGGNVTTETSKDLATFYNAGDVSWRAADCKILMGYKPSSYSFQFSIPSFQGKIGVLSEGSAGGVAIVSIRNPRSGWKKVGFVQNGYTSIQVFELPCLATNIKVEMKLQGFDNMRTPQSIAIKAIRPMP